jgi:D-serine dehydratase
LLELTTAANELSVLQKLKQDKPWLWLNPGLGCTPDARLSMADIQDAEARLQRFAPFLQTLFPELAASCGLIESELFSAPTMAKHLSQGLNPLPGHLWIKADHDLPVAGSIKARGGIYEVLHFAEALALENGLLKSTDDDYRQLADEKARALFQQYTLSVGSTGNLGLSIGLISAALGFQACVHMSVEAKQWKKDRLRNNGVTVVEHSNDYSNAVSAGRIAAEQDDYAYFVDDENSEHLFLGYSVAALRLKTQLHEKNVAVDAEHPLFVYIPCGVGGAPGGITFGLKQVFGESVHCFFAEPTQAPCMLLGMATEFKNDLTVYDAGLAINTEADGLAVGQASQLVGEIMKPLLSGIFTVEDDQLFRDLYQLKESEGLKIEPSAAAGFSGPRQLCQTDEGLDYINQHDLAGKMDQSIHLVWTTGGCFVPEDEYQGFYQRGKSL